MYTRKQYLDRECTHEEYYLQFVNPHTERMISDYLGGREGLKTAFAEDEDFNSIPLSKWDRIARWITPNMEPYGDYPTLAGQVCIAKAAARKIATA